MNKVIIAASCMAAALSFTSFTQKFDLKASIARGQEVYAAQCSSCHMEQGEGIEGVHPPLVKSEYLADKARLVKIVLQGVRGPMKVAGVAYDGEMPGISLSDTEASDVINYIRNSWGNKGAAVTPAEIQPALKSPSKDYQAY